MEGEKEKGGIKPIEGAGIKAWTQRNDSLYLWAEVKGIYRHASRIGR